MKDEGRLQFTPRGDTLFTLRPSPAMCEAVAALAECGEEVRRAGEILLASPARDFAHFARLSLILTTPSCGRCTARSMSGRSNSRPKWQS